MLDLLCPWQGLLSALRCRQSQTLRQSWHKRTPDGIMAPAAGQTDGNLTINSHFCVKTWQVFAMVVT